MIERKFLGVEDRPKDIPEDFGPGGGAAVVDGGFDQGSLFPTGMACQRGDEDGVDQVGVGYFCFQPGAEPAISALSFCPIVVPPFMCKSWGKVTSLLRSQAHAVRRSDRPKRPRK